MNKAEQKMLEDLNRIGDRHEREASGELPAAFWRDVRWYLFRKHSLARLFLWLIPLALAAWLLYQGQFSDAGVWLAVTLVVLAFNYYSAVSTAAAIKKNGQRMRAVRQATEDRQQDEGGESR